MQNGLCPQHQKVFHVCILNGVYVTDLKSFGYDMHQVVYHKLARNDLLSTICTHK